VPGGSWYAKTGSQIEKQLLICASCKSENSYTDLSLCTNGLLCCVRSVLHCNVELCWCTAGISALPVSQIPTGISALPVSDTNRH